MGDRPLFITGAARSGTSMTSGLFAEHGVWFGPCMKASKINPKGFFETEFIKRKGSGYHSPPQDMGGWKDWLREHGAPDQWAVKAGPQWWPLFREFNPVVVCCYRDRQSIIDSRNRARFKMHDLTVDVQWDLMKEIPGAVNVFPDAFIEGNFNSILPAFDALGIEFDTTIARGWVDPSLWTARPGVTRVCVLRSGGEFGPSHVQWLARQVPGLVCLSDIEIPGVHTVPLRHRWPGWWSKMELFSGSIPGDLLYLDLDTVVLGDLAELEQVGQTTLLEDFYKPGLLASGLMYIRGSDKRRVWESWISDPEGHMKRCQSRERWGDQGFLQDVLPAQTWQQALPGKVVSYKVHCQKSVPHGARVVCFHGKPRPWSARQSWVLPL